MVCIRLNPRGLWPCWCNSVFRYGRMYHARLFKEFSHGVFLLGATLFVKAHVVYSPLPEACTLTWWGAITKLFWSCWERSAFWTDKKTVSPTGLEHPIWCSSMVGFVSCELSWKGSFIMDEWTWWLLQRKGIVCQAICFKRFTQMQSKQSESSREGC